MRDMLRLETALDECLENLKTQCRNLSPESDMTDLDDVDSLASGHSSFGRIGMDIPSVRNRVVRFGKQDKDVENLRRQLVKAEEENRVLLHQVEELKNMLAKLGDKKFNEEENKSEDKDQIVDMTEGGVWNLVRRLNFTDSGSNKEVL